MSTVLSLCPVLEYRGKVAKGPAHAAISTALATQVLSTTQVVLRAPRLPLCGLVDRAGVSEVVALARGVAGRGVQLQGAGCSSLFVVEDAVVREAA